jgi:hypothetical protein
VLAELAAVQIVDGAGPDGSRQALCEETPIVIIPQEADILALRPIGSRQGSGSGHGAHLSLCVVAQGKE